MNTAHPKGTRNAFYYCSILFILRYYILRYYIYFIYYEILYIYALLLLLKGKASYFLGLPQHHFLSCPLSCSSHSIMQRTLSVVSSLNLSASVSLPVKQGSSGSLSCQPHSLALGRQWDYTAWVVSSDGSGSSPALPCTRCGLPRLFIFSSVKWI